MPFHMLLVYPNQSENSNNVLAEQVDMKLEAKKKHVSNTRIVFFPYVKMYDMYDLY